MAKWRADSGANSRAIKTKNTGVDETLQPGKLIQELPPLKLSTLKRWQHPSGSGEPSTTFIALTSPPGEVSSRTANPGKPSKRRNPIDHSITHPGPSLSIELIQGIRLQVNGQQPAERVEFACAFARGLGR